MVRFRDVPFREVSSCFQFATLPIEQSEKIDWWEGMRNKEVGIDVSQLAERPVNANCDGPFWVCSTHMASEGRRMILCRHMLEMD